MAKLNQFLTSLGKKVNYNLTDEKLKDILASEIDLPDEFAEVLEKGLMTADAAKNNPDILKRVRAEVYNGIDTDLEGLLEELGVGDDLSKSIKEQKKTTEKLKSLATYYKDEADKARKAGNKPQEDALRKQVEDLNTQIKTLKENSQKAIDQLKADNENNLNAFSVKTLLSTRQFVLPDAMKPEEKVDMVYGIINQELAQKGYKILRENGTIQLRKLDGTEVFDDKNNKIDLSNFLDGALAQRGLLKQSDPGKQDNDKNKPPVQVPGGGDSKQAPAVASAIAQIDTMLAEAAKQS